MMEERMQRTERLMRRIGYTFFVFLLFLTVAGMAVGENSKNYSSLFLLGNKGIAFSTILQVLGASILTSGLTELYFFNKRIERISAIVRMIGLFLSIAFVILIFVALFGWFPVNAWEAWCAFFISFGICFVISLFAAVTKAKWENRKYNELLDQYKQNNTEHSGEKKR